MALVIVNEGQGPRTHELGGARTTIGATPDCDVVLSGPGTEGSQFVIEATPGGHKVVVLTGSVRLNEEPCEVADLAHKDTLRVGDSMVLYKNPAAVSVAPEAEPAAPPAEPAAHAAAIPELADAITDAPEAREEPGALDDLEELDEFEDLQELADLEDEPDEVGALDEPDDDEISVVRTLNEIEDLDEVDDVAAADDDFDLEAPADDLGDDADDVPFALAAPPPSAAPAPPERPAAPPAATAPARDAGPVRFTRPLPPGCQAPSSPPPPHPGRPPA